MGDQLLPVDQVSESPQDEDEQLHRKFSFPFVGVCSIFNVRSRLAQGSFAAEDEF